MRTAPLSLAYLDRDPAELMAAARLVSAQKGRGRELKLDLSRTEARKPALTAVVSMLTRKSVTEHHAASQGEF
nr:hypothetical protein [Pseudarthrobacter phenanthrenivorans]